MTRTGWMRVRREVPRTLVHVDAQDAREEIARDGPRVSILAIAAALVPERYIQVTIRSKMQIAGIMVVRLIVLRDQGNLRSAERQIRIRRRRLKPRQPIMKPAAIRRRCLQSVVNKEQPVARIPGMKREAERTAFAARIHLPAQVQEHGFHRVRQIADHPNRPGLLDDKEAVRFPRRSRHRHRAVCENDSGKGIFQRIAVGLLRKRERRIRQPRSRTDGQGKEQAHQRGEQQAQFQIQHNFKIIGRNVSR